MRLRRKTTLIYLVLIALLFASALFLYEYQKRHPMLMGELKVERGMLTISTPIDAVIVINGNPIVGPTRSFEIRLNGSMLVELWYTTGRVDRYLIYRDISGQYRVIWHYHSS